MRALLLVATLAVGLFVGYKFYLRQEHLKEDAKSAVRVEQFDADWHEHHYNSITPGMSRADVQKTLALLGPGRVVSGAGDVSHVSWPGPILVTFQNGRVVSKSRAL